MTSSRGSDFVTTQPLAAERPQAHLHGARARKAYSSVSDGQMWWASVIVDLSGLSVALALSGFTCSARRIRIRRENAVYDEILQDRRHHQQHQKERPETVRPPAPSRTKWYGLGARPLRTS